MRQSALLAFAMMFFMASGCTTVQPGNDTLVVRAEQTRSIALDTFDVLLKFEYDNRVTLFKVNPGIKKYADFLRENEFKWINGLDSCIQAYKANRTDPDKKANLVTWLSVVEQAITEAQNWLVESAKAKSTP